MRSFRICLAVLSAFFLMSLGNVTFAQGYSGVDCAATFTDPDQLQDCEDFQYYETVPDCYAEFGTSEAEMLDYTGIDCSVDQDFDGPMDDGDLDGDLDYDADDDLIAADMIADCEYWQDNIQDDLALCQVAQFTTDPSSIPCTDTQIYSTRVGRFGFDRYYLRDCVETCHIVYEGTEIADVGCPSENVSSCATNTDGTVYDCFYGCYSLTPYQVSETTTTCSGRFRRSCTTTSTPLPFSGGPYYEAVVCPEDTSDPTGSGCGSHAIVGPIITALDAIDSAGLGTVKFTTDIDIDISFSGIDIDFKCEYYAILRRLKAAVELMCAMAMAAESTMNPNFGMLNASAITGSLGDLGNVMNGNFTATALETAVSGAANPTDGAALMDSAIAATNSQLATIFTTLLEQLETIEEDLSPEPDKVKWHSSPCHL